MLALIQCDCELLEKAREQEDGLLNSKLPSQRTCISELPFEARSTSQPAQSNPLTA